MSSRLSVTVPDDLEDVDEHLVENVDEHLVDIISHHIFNDKNSPLEQDSDQDNQKIQQKHKNEKKSILKLMYRKFMKKVRHSKQNI